jgi:hypothetical protein
MTDTEHNTEGTGMFEEEAHEPTNTKRTRYESDATTDRSQRSKQTPKTNPKYDKDAKTIKRQRPDEIKGLNLLNWLETNDDESENESDESHEELMTSMKAMMQSIKDHTKKTKKRLTKTDVMLTDITTAPSDRWQQKQPSR